MAKIALLVGGGVASALAREAHTPLAVSATVRAVARLELHSAPALLQVGPRDIARGYIDVPEATAVSIKSNSAQGFALQFMTLAPLFSAIGVTGLAGELELNGDGGVSVQRWPRPRPVELSLHYRFVLAPGIAPGEYPWPVRLTVRPLEEL